MMRFLGVALVLGICVSTAYGQSMTSINPNYGPSGSGSTVTGSGFSLTPKATRFVDVNNADVLVGVSCSSTTTCTGYPRQGLVPPGTVQTLAVFALVNGVKSGSFANFFYYGAPAISSVVPNSATASGTTGIVVNGGPFTSSPSFPGTTSIYLYSYISDRASGCASTSQCTGVNANSVLADAGQSQGAKPLVVVTPGGSATSYFRWGTTPSTPTVTSVTPNKCVREGGCAVTISGTNFLTGTTATMFTFKTAGGFPTANPATSVNCSSTTTCTAVVPNGGSGGPADIEVQTICPASTSCAGTRASASIPSTKTNAFTYGGLKIDPGYGVYLYTSENGASAQFKVSLNTQPTQPVTVTLSTAGGRGLLSSPTLNFTTANWNLPQTVTVTGRDDTGVGGAAAPASGNYGYSVTSVSTSTDPDYNNVYGNDQQFINVDNETAGVYISPIQGLVTTEGGGQATFQVALTKAPSATVTIALVSGDPTEGTVSPASLTFTTGTGAPSGWNYARTVTVTGVNDADSDGDIPYSILTKLTSADGAYSALSLPDVALVNTEASAVTRARGDGNADGKSDIVWRSSAGANLLWTMNGTAVTLGQYMPSVATTWTLVARGDFNGDRKLDLVWRENATGKIDIWIMNGNVFVSDTVYAAFPANWHIVATGDADNDGDDDIMWRNTATGANLLWFMNGSAVVLGQYMPTVAATWTLQQTGDFNADGKIDLIWRENATGKIDVWIMNGAAFSSDTLYAAFPAGWQIAATGDANADGTSDIIWRNMSTGANLLWFMTGSSVTLGQYMPTVSPTWTLDAWGDFNGDRKVDLVWRETATGKIDVWQMNGAAFVSDAVYSGYAAGSWSLVSPK